MDSLNAKASELLIGCMVAFLPLYIRLSSVNLDRISKSNALLCLIPVFLLISTLRVKSFPLLLRLIFMGAITHLILVQFEPASFVGIYESLAISFGLLFVVKYNESIVNENSETILNFMCLGAIIQCAISISQYVGHDVYKNLILYFNSGVQNVIYNSGSNNLMSGSLLNPNIFGAYLALCLPAFFRPVICYLSIPVIVLIFLSHSLMAIAAMVVSSAYYFLTKSKKTEYLFYLAVPALFIASCFMFPSQSSGRLGWWLSIFSKVDLVHFFLGMSPSWFESIKLHVGQNLVENEHSEFLSIFNIFGILGIAALGYLIHLVVQNKFKNKIFATIVFASFVNMLGNFPLHVAPLALIIMISVSYCIKGSYGINLDR